MNYKNTSLKLKLILYFSIVSAILFISVGLLFFQSNKTIILASKNKELNTLAEETSNKIERFLFERYGDIQVMSNSPILRRYDIDSKVKYEYINTVMQAYKTYDYILTTDKDGKVDVLTGVYKNDLNYKKWLPYVLSGNIYVSDFTYLDDERNYVVYLIAPLKGTNNEIKGTVVERVNFQSINDIVKNVKLGKSGYAYLASDSKEALMFPGKVNLQDIDFKSQNENIKYIKRNNINFVYSLYNLNKYNSQKANWYVVLEQPENEAFQVSNNLKKYTFFIVVISLTIIFVLALITSEKLTKPFNVLNKNLRNMEQKVIKISDELEKSVMRAKSLESLAAMSAGMAHEIRNPLTSIKGYSQYIKLELGENNCLSEDIDIVIQEVDRLNRIVNRFMSFATPKQLKLEYESINELIKDVAKIIYKDVDLNKTDLVMNLKHLPLINIDKDQIHQVLLNIIINGIQAIPSGGKITISTGLTKNNEMAEIKISDTGMGIKPEDYDKIFEPFFTTKQKGVGLGLAICSRIIDNHKGFLEVTSNADRGASFIIKLPIDKGVN